jgi:hypothetical protein
MYGTHFCLLLQLSVEPTVYERFADIISPDISSTKKPVLTLRIGDEGGESSAETECALYLELNDTTREITAVPTDQSNQSNGEQSKSQEQESQSQARKRCGIAIATGRQATDGSPTVTFAFLPVIGKGIEGEQDKGGSGGVLVRRGIMELLTRTTAQDGSDTTRAALAILWIPASPDDGEEEGEGGAYSKAWVKKA